MDSQKHYCWDNCGQTPCKCGTKEDSKLKTKECRTCKAKTEIKDRYTKTNHNCATMKEPCCTCAYHHEDETEMPCNFCIHGD